MKYQANIKKQIGNKGFYIDITANIICGLENTKIVYSDNLIFLNAMELAVNLFFERRPELKDQNCQIEILEIESVPYDTGILCVTVAIIDILSQHFKIPTNELCYLDNNGTYCFP